MTFDETVKNRISIRQFRPDPISEEQLEAILEAARLAPSGSNLQPTRYMVITQKEIREKLSPYIPQRFVVEAPVLLVCVAYRRFLDQLSEKARLTPYNQERLSWDEATLRSYLTFNAGLSLEHAVLKVTDLGLGSCIIRNFNRKSVAEALGISDRYDMVALLPLGYPATKVEPSHKRLLLSEILLPVPEK